MQKSLKILYCTDQLYKHGGVERVTTTKLNAWAKLTNNCIHLVTSEQKNKTTCYKLDGRVQCHDLEVNYFRDISYFSVENIKKTFKYVYRLRKLIRSLKPDIIVCVNSGPINLFLPYIARNCITINQYHASRINEFNSRNIRKKSVVRKAIYSLIGFTEKKFTHCVVLNETETKFFSSKNVSVIPNPIDITNYEYHIRDKIVVAAGRIAPVKGYDLLIKAWRQVSAAHPEWKLHIYGDGNDNLQKELEELIDNLGLQKSIIFCGATNDLNQVFFKSSIHVLSSYEESFGMVLLEAQACGLPSVVFNCPTGPKEIIINNKTGFLIRPNDINVFASKINYLIENPEIRKKMGENAILNARRYDVFKIIKKWIALFNDLVDQKSY